MSEKYNNRYRIKSARLEGYDYSQEGLYFITICTDGMTHYFGNIVETLYASFDEGVDLMQATPRQEMKLSEIGIIANKCWFDIPMHSKNVVLHEFVVMPNHVHGIIEIIVNNDDVGDTQRRDDACNVSTTHVDSPKSSQMKKILPKSGSLGRIVGGYKSAVSKIAHRNRFEFQWQTRYYDHIIRNTDDYSRIRNYIKNNLENWEKDKFY